MQSMSTSATPANRIPQEAPGSTPGDSGLATNVPVKLDRYDLNILRILSGSGRITKSRLAESITPAW
jgi:hypothetical protein